MSNYYEKSNITMSSNKPDRPVRNLPNTHYVHNYTKLLPNNESISKRDSRRNSLPRYETTYNNVRSNSSDMKKSSRYDFLRQTQHPYSSTIGCSNAATMNLTSNYNNNNNKNNSNSQNNDAIKNYNGHESKYQYALAKQLKEQQLQDKLTHRLSKVEKRTIEERDTFAAFDQHYQQYCTYFYDLPPAFGNKRSTPLGTRGQFKHFDNSISIRNKNMADEEDVNGKTNYSCYNDDNDASRRHKNKLQTRQHVLKEKLPNNNVKVTINNQDWLIEPHEERNRVLNLSHNPYESDDNGNDEIAAYGRLSVNNNTKTYMRNGVKQLGDGSHSEQQTDQCEQLKTIKPRKVILRSNSVLSQRHSPSRRVLMYSCPSPRIGRLSPASVQAARVRFLERERGGRVDNYKTAMPLKERLLKNYDDFAADDILNNNEQLELFPEVSSTDNEADNDDNNNYIDDDGADNADDDCDDDNEDSNVKHEDEGSSDSDDGYRNYAFKLTNAMLRDTSTQSCLSVQSADMKNTPDNLLVPSLFPHVPPYLAFSANVQRGPTLPPELFRILKWRVTNVMPKVVRTILSNSGMRLLKKTNDWMGTWGKHMKSPGFKTLRPHQKLNHLPGSFRIGRKDSCWKNLQKLMNRHSQKEFGFMPKTYVIPQDLPALRKSWSRYVARDVKWIIKPPASARGTGIRVVNKWAQIPKRRPLIVQKYIERPLLINGSKFDLRLYVLVTSINPLRAFMYNNGLARFASVKYSEKSETLNDRCMHLTNYSINKISNNYLKNEDVNACHGHKWTIKSLWSYLASRGIRTDLLWDTLRSLVLRTLMAGECAMNNMIKMNVESKYSVYELFGFDILLDADLIPWLLEVNISPSLHSELPLDAHVKAPLVQAVLNTALYNIPPKLSLERQKEIAAALSYPPSAPFCYDKRLYITYLSRQERVKHALFTRKDLTERKEYLNAILNDLTPDDIRCLIVAEDELARCAPLERIFPTSQTHKYLKFTESARYYNRLLDAWETRYANNRAEGIALLRRFCEQKYHLEVPTTPVKREFDIDFGYHFQTTAIQSNIETKGIFHQISEVDIKIIIAAISLLIAASITMLALVTFNIDQHIRNSLQ